MHICFLSKMYPPVQGGSSRYAYEITNALAEQGHQVDVYTQRVTGESMERTPNENVTVHRICNARRKLVTFETLYYSLKARRQVDLSACDVIHGTLMPASTVALPTIEGTPTVLTSHSFAPKEVRSHSPDRLPDYLLKYVFHPTNALFDGVTARRADHVIAISSQMERDLRETYGLDSDSLSLISHGVDTQRFSPTEATHQAVSEDKTTALFVGRLVTRKGADLALESLASTTSEDVELLIAGTGRDESRLRDLATDLGIASRTTFLGYVPDDELPILYSSADVFLFCSAYEGFGLVLLEAMACGTPVLGTPEGGAPDLIDNGENGFVLSHDPKSFAEGLDEMHENPGYLERISEGTLRSVQTRTWNHAAEQVEDLYRSILSD